MYIVYKVVWKKYSQNKIIIYNCEEKYDQLGNKLLNKNCVKKDLTGKQTHIKPKKFCYRTQMY